MSEPVYVVETTDDFSDESLAAKLNDLYARGYSASHVIEKDANAGDGYTVVGFSFRGRL